MGRASGTKLTPLRPYGRPRKLGLLLTGRGFVSLRRVDKCSSGGGTLGREEEEWVQQENKTWERAQHVLSRALCALILVLDPLHTSLI
jgi:hypothetical protein